MSRRLARLTLDNLGDLPLGCRSCVFWELDPVRRQRAERRRRRRAREKEAWVSRVLLEWGSCGRVAYVDDDPAGYVLYAPPDVPPGRRRVPDRAGQRGRGAAGHGDGLPRVRRSGLGRVLMQTVVKDLVKRGGIRAVEAFGDTRAAGPATGAADDYGGCVLPADYLLRVGFKTHRPHPRYPRMRLELRRWSPGATRWRAPWSGCWAPYARRGTRSPTRPAAWSGATRRAGDAQRLTGSGPVRRAAADLAEPEHAGLGVGVRRRGRPAARRPRRPRRSRRGSPGRPAGRRRRGW